MLTDQAEHVLVLGHEVLEAVPDRHPARPGRHEGCRQLPQTAHHKVSSTVYGDLELTTPVRFGGPDGTSGAGSVLLRATPDTADGYAVNLDPNLRTARLFCRDGGQTAVLAKCPCRCAPG
ncbi:hypothetical protein NRF20_40015 [Streptomyces sp. R-74717]|uniref:hypothetical protein n=1 Tax=Streptomyces sp. R-74717 TaxID=2969820 RepID=UPI0039B6CF50